MRLIRWMRIGRLMRRPPAIMNPGCRNKLLSILAGPPRRTLCHAMVQEFGKHGVEIVARARQLILDAQPCAAAPPFNEALLQRFDVTVAQSARVAKQIG